MVSGIDGQASCSFWNHAIRLQRIMDRQGEALDSGCQTFPRSHGLQDLLSRADTSTVESSHLFVII